VLCRLVRRACALVLLSLVAAPVPASPGDGIRPFATSVPELDAAVALPAWERARAALARDAARFDACLATRAACGDPRRAAWRTLMGALAAETPRTRLEAVNRFVNTVPYASDEDAFGARDHWAGPWAFLVGRGDCEDYAIAKYATLKRLGVAATDMRILVVEDVVRDLAHAVLAVRTDAGVWLLDNQSDTLLDAATTTRYRPYYAVNDAGRWLFGLPAAATPTR